MLQSARERGAMNLCDNGDVAEMQRKLTAILSADVVGYSGLMEADETGTLGRLKANRSTIFDPNVATHGGRVFKLLGDGALVEFSSVVAAVNCALAIQEGTKRAEQELSEAKRIRYRIGINLGDIIIDGDDIYGEGVNVAARLQTLAPVGGIALSKTVRDHVKGKLSCEFDDMGEHTVKNIETPVHVFFVRTAGNGEPNAANLNSSIGVTTKHARLVASNLPAHTTSFVGRATEVAELVELLRAHKLVTLTGVGGVGKTRLALRVAGELVLKFPDGVWLVELAPVSDPAVVPDAVATALGITAQGAGSVTAAIAEALSGRRLLIVLDNCEHVLDAAAEIVQAILGRTDAVKVIATSREGLRVGDEHLWPVPSLETRSGLASAAVQLFTERARAVKPGFVLGEGAEAEAVKNICQRLDGIALAIELAAARMVSMNPVELLARLTDRFRLLSGSRRGLERHQTLRQAVQWSYDLLTDDERTLLNRCSVFAGGFDLLAASKICGGENMDEYAILDLLDSLVRKSLVTTEQVANNTRYGLLETIRQFAEERLAAAGEMDDLRDRHAKHFAEQAVAYWDIWDGPLQRQSSVWTEVEYANLRAGFRWTAERADLVTAATIAAHTANMCAALQRFEPVRWIEEILPAATEADIRQLPRLYAAATLAVLDGRPGDVANYCAKVLSLREGPQYDPFEPGWGIGLPVILSFAATGNVGDAAEQAIAIYRELTTKNGLSRVAGLVGLAWILTALGRGDESRTAATEAVAAARAHGNPMWLAFAQNGFGRAHSNTDPDLALNALRSGASHARENGDLQAEGLCMQDLAFVEGLVGDPRDALEQFDRLNDRNFRSGAQFHLREMLGFLTLLFDRSGRHDIAATMYGASRASPYVVGLAPCAARLQVALGKERFDACVAQGAAMPFGDAYDYARQQIAMALRQLGSSE